MNAILANTVMLENGTNLAIKWYFLKTRPENDYHTLLAFCHDLLYWLLSGGISVTAGHQQQAEDYLVQSG